MCQVRPLLGVFHHFLAACGVVFGYADLLAYVLFGYPQSFLHSELDGQSVRVPPGFALDVEALHRLVAAEDVLDRA